MHEVLKIDTDSGPARVDLSRPAGAPAYLLVFTHGAGGGVDAADLRALRDGVLTAGAAAAGVEQPYRVAGRRMPGAATAKQDRAWCQAVAGIRERCPDAPLVLAGRSNGARVACRTARELGAAAVVALAFPLRPRGSRERSRAGELRAAGVPTLVVNGDRDPFGVPDPADAAAVIVRPGERHELAKDPEGAAQAAVAWLAGVLGRP